jgi:hypothetical protein
MAAAPPAQVSAEMKRALAEENRNSMVGLRQLEALPMVPALGGACARAAIAPRPARFHRSMENPDGGPSVTELQSERFTLG